MIVGVVQDSDVTFFRGEEGGQEFFSGGSANSVEARGQRERGSGGGSSLDRGSTQFENE
jgi:hypothetical protein